MGVGHNTQERELFRDINEKNQLSRRLRTMTSRIRRWNKSLEERRNHRWRKRYQRSIDRFSTEIGALRDAVLARGRNLKARIESELEVSPSEVEAFQAQFKKEADELRQARADLGEAKAALHRAEGLATESGATVDSGALLNQLRRKHRLAALQARSERQDVERVEKELASEAADREALERELRNVLLELETL